MNKVSVLLAVFNGENYIQEAIESVLSQTYSDFELIIADDGSTDSTRTILSLYKNHTKITVLTLEHAGKVNAFNKAFEASDFSSSICLFAHDDVLLPQSIEERVNMISKGLEVAYQDFFICDKELKIIKRFYGENGKDLTWQNDAKTFTRRNLVSGGSIIISRKIANKVFPIPPILLFEDWWISFLALYFSDKIAFIDKPLLKYRIHGGNDNGAFNTGNNFKPRMLRDWERHGSIYCCLAEQLKQELQRDKLYAFNNKIIDSLRCNNLLEKNTINNRPTFPSPSLLRNVGLKKFILAQILLTPFANTIHHYWEKGISWIE
jgi:glycosyltransferase involved in cell wall biosynthesis